MQVQEKILIKRDDFDLFKISRTLRDYWNLDSDLSALGRTFLNKNSNVVELRVLLTKFLFLYL